MTGHIMSIRDSINVKTLSILKTNLRIVYKKFQVVYQHPAENIVVSKAQYITFL